MTEKLVQGRDRDRYMSYENAVIVSSQRQCALEATSIQEGRKEERKEDRKKRLNTHVGRGGGGGDDDEYMTT